MGSLVLTMKGTAQVFILSSILVLVQGQDNGAEAPDFRCPEKNGKFRDFEQCDLFYICRNDVATIEFCPEGLLFDDKVPNHEKCVLPHNADCGDRIYVQEPSPDRDPKCERAMACSTILTRILATSTSNVTMEMLLSCPAPYPWSSTSSLAVV